MNIFDNISKTLVKLSSAIEKYSDSQQTLIDVSKLSRPTQAFLAGIYGKKTKLLTQDQIRAALEKYKTSKNYTDYNKKQFLGKKVPESLRPSLDTHFDDENPITEESILNRMENAHEWGKDRAEKYYVKEDSWSGAQRFHEDTHEKVIPIRFSSEKYMELYNDPILKKFLQIKSNHFGGVTDPIGWALVSPINKNIWVINQVQSDIIPKFLSIKQQVSRPEKINSDEVITRLQATGREAWIPFVQGNPQLMGALMESPNEINNLPANLTDPNRIQQFINEQTEGIQQGQVQTFSEEGLELTQEEISYIESKLSGVIENWPKIVLQTVLRMARQAGVHNVYMNTPNTVTDTAHEGKRNYFYQELPKELGFREVTVNLRGKPETFWYRTAHQKLKIPLKIG